MTERRSTILPMSPGDANEPESRETRLVGFLAFSPIDCLCERLPDPDLRCLRFPILMNESILGPGGRQERLTNARVWNEIYTYGTREIQVLVGFRGRLSCG